MGREVSDKQVYEFIGLLKQMKPEDIMGLFLALNVKFLTDKVDKETKKAIPRDAADCIEDAIVAFGQCPRKRRRMIIRSMRAAIRGSDK